jgi:uncharacterized protein YqeY
MSLKSTIEQEIKKAMLAKDKGRLTPLRSIKSLILLAETEKGASEELSADAEIKLLTKAAKQRKDSLEVYRNQNRLDLAGVEEAELKVIEEFLPKQLTQEEIEDSVRKIIEQIGAKGMKDMGKVMGMATKQLSGKADGKIISDVTKSMLTV